MVNVAKLKAAVAEAGIEQAELASAIGVSVPQVSRLLSGKRRLRVETAEAILRVLRERTGRKRGLTLNDLVGTGKAA